MNYNNWTRPEDDGALDAYLEKLGLTQALDSFLSTPKMNDMYHEMFVGSCDGLKACIETLPESVRAVLLEKMEVYESAETAFVNRSIVDFKEHMATLMGANEYTLGDASGVVQCYKTALENHAESLENLAMELAGEQLDYLVDSYKKIWLSVLRDVESQEDKFAILKAALGNDIPEGIDLEKCVVIEVDASKMFGHDEDDTEEGEDEE